MTINYGSYTVHVRLWVQKCPSQSELTKTAIMLMIMRGKRSRLVLEQRKTEERDFRVWSSETLHFFPTPSPLFYSHHFFFSFLVLCSETAGKRLVRRLVAHCSRRFLGTSSKYCISCHLPLRRTILGPALSVRLSEVSVF